MHSLFGPAAKPQTAKEVGTGQMFDRCSASGSWLYLNLGCAVQIHREKAWLGVNVQASIRGSADMLIGSCSTRNQQLITANNPPIALSLPCLPYHNCPLHLPLLLPTPSTPCFVRLKEGAHDTPT